MKAALGRAWRMFSANVSYWLRCASSVITITSCAVRQHRHLRLACRLVDAELLDQREHVAVISLEQLPQVGRVRRRGPRASLEMTPASANSPWSWLSSSVRSVTMTKVHAPGSRRSTFWVNHSIERLLPDPWVCQNTPRRLSPAARMRTQVLDRSVHAEHLVVAGDALHQAAGPLEVGDEVLDQVEEASWAQVPRMAVSRRRRPECRRRR